VIDLVNLPQTYIDKYGRDKVTEIIGQGPSMMSMWLSRKRFPVEAVQKLLDFDPSVLHGIKPLYTNPEPGKKLVILMPLNGSPEPEVLDAFSRLYDPKEMDFRRVAFNNLSVARNALAGEFLRGPWDKAIWWDGDTIPPYGDAAAFKRLCQTPNMPDVFAGVHSIYRMLVHKQPFVSAVYVGRKKGAPAQFGGGEHESTKQMVKRGPRDELRDADWCGFGFVLTDRKIFEDIIKTQGDEIRVTNEGLRNRFGYDHAFFTPTGVNVPGDDIPFCVRAAKAGHGVKIDMSVFAAHIGNHAYTYQDL
jgi:hypothetical protein